MFLRGIIEELLWFIRGETNIRSLVLNGVNIWNEWPLKHYLKSNNFIVKPYSPEWSEAMVEFIKSIKLDPEFATKWGDLGPVYGKQWRAWEGPDGKIYDQLAQVIEDIKKSSTSRRLIVNAWNVANIPDMITSGLPPCHLMYQFFVRGNLLSCIVTIRSWDVFLGGPFNIASYALLTMMVAQVTGLNASELLISSGDTHIYKNHIDLAREQLQREPMALPKIVINPNIGKIDDFSYNDFKLVGYHSHPQIKADIAI